MATIGHPSRTAAALFSVLLPSSVDPFGIADSCRAVPNVGSPFPRCPAACISLTFGIPISAVNSFLPQRPAAPTPPSSGSQSDRQTAPPLLLFLHNGVQQTPHLVFPATNLFMEPGAPHGSQTSPAPLRDPILSVLPVARPPRSSTPPSGVKNCRHPLAVRAPFSSRIRSVEAPSLSSCRSQLRNFTHIVGHTCSTSSLVPSSPSPIR